VKDRWEFCEPRKGCQIRVNRGGYYHHGIYVDDNTVVHFGGAESDITADPDGIEVRAVTLGQFLRDGFLEVRKVSFPALHGFFKPERAAANAMSHIGEGGYNLLRNNCEHFSNLCARGKKESGQAAAFGANDSESL
jgi:hypothetical protein